MYARSQRPPPLLDRARNAGAPGSRTSDPPRATRSILLREVLVFALLIVPSMVLGWFVTDPASIGFPVFACATIARDLGLVALIAYFTWRNREAPSSFGFARAGAGRELLLGVALFVPLAIVMIALGVFLRQAGLSGPRAAPTFLEPHGPGQTALAILLVAVVAVAEETIFRGYFLRRIESLTGRSWIAVVLSSALFAVGHGYEGEAGMVVVGAMGLVYALIAVRRRSLVAPIALHFLQDLFAVVLVPLWRGVH